MAFLTRLRVLAEVTGTGIQGKDAYYSPWVVNQDAPGPGPLPYPLASGADTVVPVPTGCTAALLLPTVGSTVAKKVGGAAGPSMHPSNPFLYSFPAGTTTITINCAAPGEPGFRIHWG